MALAHLPPGIEAGIRHGLADALHPVFIAGLPIVALAFIVTLFIHELPLRMTAHVAAGRTAPTPLGAEERSLN